MKSWILYIHHINKLKLPITDKHFMLYPKQNVTCPITTCGYFVEVIEIGGKVHDMILHIKWGVHEVGSNFIWILYHRHFFQIPRSRLFIQCTKHFVIIFILYRNCDNNAMNYLSYGTQTCVLLEAAHWDIII